MDVRQFFTSPAASQDSDTVRSKFFAAQGKTDATPSTTVSPASAEQGIPQTSPDNAPLASQSPSPAKKPRPNPSPTKQKQQQTKRKANDDSKGAEGASGGGSAKKPRKQPVWAGGERMAPPNAGQKEVPTGSPNCLAGKAFVITGVLDSLEREAAEDLIKSYGGIIKSGVSSKVNFLLSGEVLDDGRKREEGSKYRKMLEFQKKRDKKGKKVCDIALIDEDGLFDMLRKSNPASASAPAPAPAPAPVNPYATNAFAQQKQAAPAPAPVNPYATNAFAQQKQAKPAAAAAPPPANPYAANAFKQQAASSVSAPTPPSSAVHSGPAVPPPATATTSGPPLPPPKARDNALWADKYKPKRPRDLVGNPGIVSKLQTWLKTWEKTHLHGGPKPRFSRENPGAKAVLLSGPPGIGKSSLASIVATDLGYDVHEMNASDARNKASLSQGLGDVVGTRVLSFAPKVKPKKRLIIMDEVDGMSSGDRGGCAELAVLIKKSKTPMICICNDRQKPAVRTLANHCYDLRFRRPDVNSIVKRMLQVAQAEGLKAEPNAIALIVEQCGNDIRQVMNAMQMWARRSGDMRYMAVKGQMATLQKDEALRLSPFDGVNRLCDRRLGLEKRIDGYFVDYDLVPLLLQDSYLQRLPSVGPGAPDTDKLGMVQQLARAADAMADIDLVERKVREEQRWDLLPTAALLSVRTAAKCTGGMRAQQQFPTWFGNNSRKTKRTRLLGELALHTNSRVSGGTSALRMHYLPVLQSALYPPLKGPGGATNVSGVMEFVDAYGLSREDVWETVPEFGFGAEVKQLLDGIESKTKSAFTRQYNKGSHRSQALQVGVDPKVAKKPAKSDSAAKSKGKGKGKAKKKK